MNPVVGFVLPDHLDESLEVFGIDGAPIGELLHEPVSGGVMWEIAAGARGAGRRRTAVWSHAVTARARSIRRGTRGR